MLFMLVALLVQPILFSIETELNMQDPVEEWPSTINIESMLFCLSLTLLFIGCGRGGGLFKVARLPQRVAFTHSKHRVEQIWQTKPFLQWLDWRHYAG